MPNSELVRSQYFDDPQREVWHARVANLLEMGLALPAGAVALGSSMFTDTANPILVQQRVGPDGQLRNFAKIRTMDESVTSGESQQINGVVDDRASFIANLIRASGLDETEQLKMVGEELALIGCRDLLPDSLEDLERVAYMAYKKGLEPDKKFFQNWYTGPYGELHGVFGVGQQWRRFGDSDLTKYEAMCLENYWFEKTNFKLELSILGLSPAILGFATIKAAYTQLRKLLPPILPRA